MRHGGTRSATRDVDGDLRLWDADRIERLDSQTDVSEVQRVGETMVYRRGVQLHVVGLLAGPDHVAVSRGARVELVKWR